MVFKCSIPGCENTSNQAITHCLPKDPQMRLKWCDILHRSDLIHVSGRQRHNFRICDVHFAEDAKFPSAKNRTNLKFDAVPTLYLKSVSNLESQKPSDFEESFAQPVLKGAEIGESTPSTSSVPDILPLFKGDADLGNQEDPPSGSQTPKRKGVILPTRLLRSVGVARAKDLTPKALKLYRIVKDLKKNTRRLDFQNASNKERLTEAMKFAESPDFSKAKLNQRCLNFINCQLRMLKKNPRGRRFTFEDKVFALSLLKQGPKAYKVLRSTFALPSRKTLMNILNKVHFTVGINDKIMDVLRSSVKKLESLDTHCVLIFDEIFLEPSLTYDKKWDEVIGFEHINANKRLQFADHALVFMIQGLRKKWKQPISFHFCQGGMNSDQLKVILKNTILVLQEIGFNIECTVCDQYSANVNAIKKLKEESPKMSASDVDIFQIGDQEVVAIYDPPHLLKGMRNNLISANLTFANNNMKKEASWDHIIKLYELDEDDFNTRMCYKLTDSHVYKEKLKKMKVEHAAQVFSHRVSSTMRWTVKHGQEGILPPSAEGTADFISFMGSSF